jgi:hypothetical protein
MLSSLSRLQIPVRPKKNQETITALVIISSTGIDSQLQLEKRGTTRLEAMLS